MSKRQNKQNILTRMRRFMNEAGQSTTEYILILAVVVLIAMKFKDKIGTQISDATDKIGSKIANEVDQLDK